MFSRTLLVAFSVFLAVGQAHAQEARRYVHASEGIASGASFSLADGQQYWQSTAANGAVIFPLHVEEGETITRVEVFLENTNALAQTASIRRKAMGSAATTLIASGSSPATTGNHTITINLAEAVVGDNQWYLRLQMGATLSGNRVRGLRVTVDRPVAGLQGPRVPGGRDRREYEPEIRVGSDAVGANLEGEPKRDVSRGHVRISDLRYLHAIDEESRGGKPVRYPNRRRDAVVLHAE